MFFEFTKKCVQGTYTSGGTSYVSMSYGAARELYSKLKGMFRIRATGKKYMVWNTFRLICRSCGTHEVCKLTNIKCRKGTCPRWELLEDV